jgi:nitrous oxidase accessory protein NosD
MKINQSVTLTGLNEGVLNFEQFNDITLINCDNVIILDCIIKDSKNTGIRLIGCNNITIVCNQISNVRSGIYAENCTNINIHDNHMLNMQGPMPQAQFVQFNNSTGRIVNNKLENIFGQSNPEDAINIFKSNGTQDNPILITGNWIRGGGPSKSGGGIMLGDNGGSYQVASDNILVNPGQYGMAVAGGSSMTISNNVIFGKQQAFTNVGLYAWAQAGQSCSNITIGGNRVNWTKSDGTSNNWWNGGNCGVIAGWSTNTYDTALNEAVLPLNL